MSPIQKKLFNQSEIHWIAKILGDTSMGLTGTEITHLLQQANILDVDPSSAKWKRLYNALSQKQNITTHVLEFIRLAMKPANFIDNPNTNRYEILRSNLNSALASCGLKVKETGELALCNKASDLTKAESRANKLKMDLQKRHIHPEVIKFCTAELLHSNYFHAVFEAVTSVFVKLRQLTGSIEDGHELANTCFGRNKPKLFINAFKTESEKMEQSGFNELIKGLYSMFHNTISHEAKINLEVTQRDAEDLLTLVSMIHRRIDEASK